MRTRDAEDTWLPMVDKRGVVLHVKRIKDSSLVCVRSVVTVDAPLEKVSLCEQNVIPLLNQKDNPPSSCIIPFFV